MTEKRIAVLADIHGNSIALEAVLQDIRDQGSVDEYWFLGDYVAIGHDPLGVLERFTTLPTARFIRGNTDRYVTSGDLPGPSQEQLLEDPSLLSMVVSLARNFAWTAGAVSAIGWLPWLSELPLDMRTELPNGKRVLAVHASPGTDDGGGIHPGRSDAELRKLLSGAQADLVLIGHTHTPFIRQIDDVQVINPGSVSNPFPPDLRGCYAMLVCTPETYKVELKRVNYDRKAVIREARRVRHPAAEVIGRYMDGEHKPPW
jgi:putative phosphoesterase